MKTCFISYCSDDRVLVNGFYNLIKDIYNDWVFYYTEKEENGTNTGELSKQLRKNLDTSDVMIAFVTENYVRSTIALAEISSFWYMDKKSFQ